MHSLHVNIMLFYIMDLSIYRFWPGGGGSWIQSPVDAKK